MTERKIIFTAETVLMCSLFEQDRFDHAINHGVTRLMWEDHDLGLIWEAMEQNRRVGFPHDLAALFFALESEGEDLTRLMLDLATDFPDFRRSTLSVAWMIEKAFGGRQ